MMTRRQRKKALGRTFDDDDGDGDDGDDDDGDDDDDDDDDDDHDTNHEYFFLDELSYKR